MLLVLYGAIAKPGYVSREYFRAMGFDTVQKYNYISDAPQLTTQYGTRNLVSHEEFLENTDSLFRYEVGGMWVGFHQKDISDAVCDKRNSLLSLSTGEIGFLSEIKRVYADKVCLVYMYIDDTTLQNIVSALDVSPEEARVRLETGVAVKQGYLKYQSIFDYTVIYGGEASQFDEACLRMQYERILDATLHGQREELCFADVFLSYTRADQAVYEAIRGVLTKQGISVFDFDQLAPGTEWADAILNAIRHAKVIVPIVSARSAGSRFVREEIKCALESANSNGTTVVPLIEQGVGVEVLEDIHEGLSLLPCVTVENGDVDSAVERLASDIRTMLTAEESLKAYSREVENYLYLKMYDRALQAQEAHCALCAEIYASTGGVLVSAEAFLLSHIKHISILIDMGRLAEAIDECFDAISMDMDGESYDLLADQLALCFANLGMTEAEVRAMVASRLGGMSAYVTETGGALEHYYLSKQNDLVGRFLSMCVKSDTTETERETQTGFEDETRIASYGERALELFEQLIGDGRDVSRHDLILGYERILNYCKHIGLGGEVADICIRRITELRAAEDTHPSVGESLTADALKIYLGQAVPRSGAYDVFLSYKSEDESLARKVYDFLVQNGKEVFFARETLPQLGESEYKKMIFDAIDRSKHMVVVSSRPDYLKTKWVEREWDTFDNELIDGRKNGNLLLILTDDIYADKSKLPIVLRKKEILRMSEFRTRLLPYLR